MPRGRNDPRQFDLLGPPPAAADARVVVPVPRPAAAALDDERLVDALNQHLFGSADRAPPLADLVGEAAARRLTAAVGPLVQLLRRSRGHDLARPTAMPPAVAATLGAIGDDAAGPALAEVATAPLHHAAPTRAAALEALALLGFRPARTAAVAALDDPDSAVRRAACRLAGAIGVATATARLSEIAGTDLPPVAAEATLALGHLGHRAAKATLEASLDRAAPVDLPRVLAALRGLADAESAVHVGRAADRMDEEGRLLAVAVLGEIGGQAAVTWLVRRAQDARTAVRAAAAGALSGIEGPSVAGVLARLADDPDPAVRDVARRGLRGREDPW